MKDKLKMKFNVLAVFCILIFCFALTPITFQNDTYYTIKIGEHIVQTGEIDMQDPFSWHEDLPYTYNHWLYDVSTYLVYDFGENIGIGGFCSLYIATIILCMILGLVIYFASCKLCKNQFVSFFVTMATMYLLKNFIAARAQLVTFILFALTILFIEKFLETKKKRYAVALIIIPIIIANIHLAVFPFYFILYLPYIAEYIIAILGEIVIYRKLKIQKIKLKIKRLSKDNKNQEKVEKLKEDLNKLNEKVDKIKIKRSKNLQNPYKIKLIKNDNVKWLILIMVICIFTGLLTPLGDTPYTYLFKTLQGNTTQNINEHLPMTLIDESEACCCLILFLAPLIFTKVKIRLSDLFMIGGLCILMLSSRRQVTMFVIVGSVILNRLITQLIVIYNDEKYIENMEKRATSIIGVLIISILTLCLTYYLAKDKVGDKYIDESSYPVQACDYILKNIDLGKARFYNEYNYGSYMLFRGIPVFIDSRADLYAPEFSGKSDDIFMDFIETSGIAKFYEDIFKKYDITHVITYENSKMNMIIEKTKDPNYKQLYKDDYFVVYERLSN